MSTTPQPPRPPLPPPAPRSGSHVVAIALMVLALIILVSVVALWTGFRILSRSVHVQVNDGGGEKKEVSIKTPFGGIEVNKDKTVSEASLGLPIYPGAVQSKNNNSARVNLGFFGKENLRVVAANFDSTDPIEKVADFYHKRLGTEVTKFTQKNNEGKTVFEIKKSDSERNVALKDNGEGTGIELVRVSHGKEDTN
jgi:hypothetical protein